MARALVAETKMINAMLSDHWASEAAVRARKHGEKKPEADFQEGELVLCTKPFYEKGRGVILPQCDGPYLISRVPHPHVVILVDVLTRTPAYRGKPLSVARLVKYSFPVEYIIPEPENC